MLQLRGTFHNLSRRHTFVSIALVQEDTAGSFRQAAGGGPHHRLGHHCFAELRMGRVSAFSHHIPATKSAMPCL